MAGKLAGFFVSTGTQGGGQETVRNMSGVLWEVVSTDQFLSFYQGFGTKNVQAFISWFLYFPDYKE
ncbi:hypothetical protein QQ045_022988 [Rhodiola kirilowii]